MMDHHARSRAPLCSVIALSLVSMLLPAVGLSGTDTIAVVQGETLAGRGSNRIDSSSAREGRVLKISTEWAATGTISIDEHASKILVRGTGDPCDGEPVLEVAIGTDKVLTEIYPDKHWKLGIEDISLPPGDHKVAVRLKNPRHRTACRRAVYVDVIYLEKSPVETEQLGNQPVDNDAPVSGEAVPLGDLPGWKQIFVDDFNQDVALGDFPKAVEGSWGAYPYPWRDTRGQAASSPEDGGWYFPEKTVSIDNGVMDIWLHSELIDGVYKRLVAAPQPRIHGPNEPARRGQLYGRYAVRFRADMVAGYKTAWLLWPDSGQWPRDGEIDFPEGNLTGDIHGYMHWQDATRGDQQYYALSGYSYHDWHTAVIEWGPDQVTFLLDGVLIPNASNNISQWHSRIPDTPMHWVIQTETRLDAVQPTSADQGHVEIDWVAVWEKR